MYLLATLATKLILNCDTLPSETTDILMISMLDQTTLDFYDVNLEADICS